MSDRRIPREGALRVRLLAGAAVIACIPALPVMAQVAPASGQSAASTNTPGADGLAPGEIYVDADSASRQGDVVTANGTAEDRVFARVRNHSLRAEEITHDLKNGVTTAAGQAEVVAPDGTVVHASRVELDSDLKAGVATDLALRLANGASLMAATAVRRSENVSELNRVIFTPCPICDVNGPKQPSVSIQADKAVQDQDLRAILYRNAVFKVGGVPVFYLPVFAHPDPSVDRASGFLTPSSTMTKAAALRSRRPIFTSYRHRKTG